MNNLLTTNDAPAGLKPVTFPLPLLLNSDQIELLVRGAGR